MSNEELWQAVLAQVQLTTSAVNFSNWFRNTSVISQGDSRVVVSVPSDFVKGWLENKYNREILKIIHDLNPEVKITEYVVGKNLVKTSPRVHRGISEEVSDQLEFQELKVNKETGLNPRYTFDSFVVGNFNELPYAAAMAVTKSPGSVYNPLFVYGLVGLGKTHLLQAIGNEILKNHPQKKVKYVSSEKFTSEVVAGVRNKEMEPFKYRYRNTDVLIIDDIQFLAGREKTQEEFFNIFNVLYENNRQIILSSDRPPKAIQSLAERLRSRFEGGMIADISSPDLETRIAILKTKAQEKGIVLKEELYNYIASSIQRNIRELEGILNRLAAYQRMNNQEVDLNIAKALLKNVLSAPTQMVTPKKIIQVVVDFYDLKEKDLLNPSRKKEIVKPRQIAMYLLREELKSSFPFIGRKFGGKDHTTAIHAYQKICRELVIDKKLEGEIDIIKERVMLA